MFGCHLLPPRNIISREVQNNPDSSQHSSVGYRLSKSTAPQPQPLCLYLHVYQLSPCSHCWETGSGTQESQATHE